MTSTRPLLTGVVARTRVLLDGRPLLDWLGPDGYAWIRDGAGFVTSGAIAAVPTTEVAAALHAIDVDDVIRRAGTGPIAVGALPFRDASTATLTIPARVVGLDADGTRWVTELVGIASTQPSSGGEPAPNEPLTVADQATWERNVREVLERIRRHELQKLVLARQIVVHSDVAFEPRLLLERLARTQPGSFVYGAPGFVGASPELLLRRSGTTIVSRPMAGTVARHADAHDDEQAMHALAESAKDAVEHRLVVDEVVRLLERWCTDVVASVRPEVARLTNVAHLATRITARLGESEPSALDLALALHPTPAVGGCPTDVALAAIAELEAFDRGRYAGPVGWVDADGNGEWAVALRGAEIAGSRAIVRAGAGIVAGSDPPEEWLETEAKFATVLAALRIS